MKLVVVAFSIISLVVGGFLFKEIVKVLQERCEKMQHLSRKSTLVNCVVVVEAGGKERKREKKPSLFEKGKKERKKEKERRETKRKKRTEKKFAHATHSQPPAKPLVYKYFIIIENNFSYRFRLI